jgi:hypothetical protein
MISGSDIDDMGYHEVREKYEKTFPDFAEDEVKFIFFREGWYQATSNILNNPDVTFSWRHANEK